MSSPRSGPSRSPRVAAGDTAGPAAAADTPSVRPRARPPHLRRSSMVFRIAMGIFCIGGSALLVVLVLFASGIRHFPLWVWLLVALAPAGLAIGAFGVRKAGLAVGPDRE